MTSTEIGAAEEQVVVIESNNLDRLGIQHGFTPLYHMGRDLMRCRDLFHPNNVRLIPREDHEKDTTFRALVAYVLFEHDGWYWSYLRGGKSTEQRLAGRMSLGIGGHVNQVDVDSVDYTIVANGGTPNYMVHPFEAAKRAAKRESNQEIIPDQRYDRDPHYQFIGVINDRVSEVGSVHLGMVYHVRLYSPQVALKGVEDMRGGHWTSPTALKNHDYALYETWSKFLIDQHILG